MRKMPRTTTVITLLVTLALGDVGCGVRTPKAPRTGKVTEIVHDSRACYDQEEKTILVQYRPAGTDKIGDPWPLTVFCATPEQVESLVVGGPVTE